MSVVLPPLLEPEEPDEPEEPLLPVLGVTVGVTLIGLLALPGVPLILFPEASSALVPVSLLAWYVTQTKLLSVAMTLRSMLE